MRVIPGGGVAGAPSLAIDVASVADFPRAREAIVRELGIHRGAKGGTSARRSVFYHARHGLVHFFFAVLGLACRRPRFASRHLAHALCRALMATEAQLARYGRGHIGACRRRAVRA